MVERWVGGALMLGVLAGAAWAGAAATAPTVALEDMIGPPSDPQAAEPTDRPKTHVETATAGRHAYTVRFEAPVDGVMPRDPVTYTAFKQGFQPNQFVRMENVGTTDVVDPWILVNGKRDWRTVEAIVADAVRGCTTDAEKARAIYEAECRAHFHACTWDDEVREPVRARNVYGYTLCGDESAVLAKLYATAGLKMKLLPIEAHVVNEVFYDGAWHLFDADQRGLFLLPDNKTVGSKEQLVADHDLVKRSHWYGLGARYNLAQVQMLVGCFTPRPQEWQLGDFHGRPMGLTLRPGEALEWRWDHVGKHYTGGQAGAKTGETCLLGWQGAWATLCNGRWSYRPPLGERHAAAGLAVSENVTLGERPALRPTAAGKAMRAVWKLTAPYIMVGGRVTLEGLVLGARDRATVSFSADGQVWKELWRREGLGAAKQVVSLDGCLSLPKQPNYACFVQIELLAAGKPTDAGLAGVLLETDLQMARLSLPELETGANTIEYTDRTEGPRAVKITHAWIERPTLVQPAAPTLVSPADGTTLAGTRGPFTWQAPGTQPSEIVDYHVEVCDRADLRWPVSPVFERLSSLTTSAGKTEWTAPRAGLLNPEQDYWWHVRAKNRQGVWGPWSPAARFRCTAPGVPLEVQVETGEAGQLVLAWKANPAGLKPASYKVYGSDEKGFTASDAEYEVYIGRGFCKTPEEYKAAPAENTPQSRAKWPANLVAKTDGARWPLPAGSVKAYYRVVAVDSRGHESGPSEMAVLPAGTIFSRPPATAKVGEALRYEVGVVRSLGDLQFRPVPGMGLATPAYWDRETVTVTLAEGPKWLKVDAQGVLAGTPTASDVGEQAVVLKVETSRGGQAEQRFTLRVGN